MRMSSLDDVAETHEDSEQTESSSSSAARTQVAKRLRRWAEHGPES